LDRAPLEGLRYAEERDLNREVEGGESNAATAEWECANEFLRMGCPMRTPRTAAYQEQRDDRRKAYREQVDVPRSKDDRQKALVIERNGLRDEMAGYSKRNRSRYKNESRETPGAKSANHLQFSLGLAATILP